MLLVYLLLLLVIYPHELNKLIHLDYINKITHIFLKTARKIFVFTSIEWLLKITEGKCV